VEAAKTSWEAQAEGKGALQVPRIFYSSRTVRAEYGQCLAAKSGVSLAEALES